MTDNCQKCRKTKPKTYKIGDKFGTRTVMSEQGVNSHNHTLIKVKCECGNESTLSVSKLKKSKSCPKCAIIRNTKHGYARRHSLAGDHDLYNIYLAMISRCYKSTNASYHRYGGRGIIVCERWLNSIHKFIDDMGPRPTIKHSIDRIDVDGNYEPKNCRWATPKEQSNNKCINHIKGK